MNLLAVSKVSKSFQGIAAVRDISLKLADRKKIGILGQTGAGKTSLLKMIAGLEQKDSGSILFDGIEVKGPAETLVAGHEEIAYLSQQFELPKFLTVEEALQRREEITKTSSKRLYKACDISHLLEKDTRALSGGEKQRVGLATALIRYPKLLLLDEPFSNLDLIHKQEIKTVVETIYEDWVSSIILSSHDPSDLLPWADEIWVMKKGKIVQKGRPKHIYWHPKNRLVAGLAGPYNLLNMKKWGISSNHPFTESGTHAIVRPEQILLSQEPDKEKKGVVKEARFQGSLEILIIEVHGEEIIAAGSPGMVEEGTEVTVSLKT